MKSSEYVTATDFPNKDEWHENYFGVRPKHLDCPPVNFSCHVGKHYMMASVILGWFNYTDVGSRVDFFFFFSEGRWVGRYWKLISHTPAANDITGAGRPAGYFSLIFFFTVWITNVSFIFYACQWLKHAGTDKKNLLTILSGKKNQNKIKKTTGAFPPHFTFSTQPMTKLSKEACH